MQGIRVAIIGCGRMGEVRAAAVTSLGAKICAVVDVDVERARRLADRYAASEHFQDGQQIDWTGIDAAFICTPPAYRGQVAVEALRRGVSLLIEKPLGLSVSHCQALADEAEARNVLVAVGYMNRYRPSVLRARAHLQATAPLGLLGHWVCKPYAVPWWGQADLSGGPINEQATHIVDLARYLVGEITAVSAVAPTSLKLAPYGMTATLEFAAGIQGTLVYSCAGNVKDIGMRVLTADGPICLNGWEFQLDTAVDSVPLDPATPFEDVFTTETRAFLAAAQSNDRSSVNALIRDAMRTQAAVDALQRALETGESVELTKPRTIREALSHVG